MWLWLLRLNRARPQICCGPIVTRRFVRLGCGLLCIVAISCRSQDEQLQSHREKLQSLAATTQAIGEAWLAGSTSPTFTKTALRQASFLVEKERTAIASTPAALAEPRGAELSQ